MLNPTDLPTGSILAVFAERVSDKLAGLDKF